MKHFHNPIITDSRLHLDLVSTTPSSTNLAINLHKLIVLVGYHEYRQVIYPGICALSNIIR